MANQFLSLSLFLMMLSFFIVMNSISKFEEAKANPVLNSIAQTFSTNIKKNELGMYEKVSSTLFTSSGDTLTEIEGLFSGNIAGIQVARNRLGTVLFINLSVRALQRAMNGSGPFMQTLATMLQSDDKQAPYKMDMLLNVSFPVQDFQNENSDAYKALLRAAGGLAERVEAMGLPKRLVSIGIKTGQADTVDLYFYKYEPYSLAMKNKKQEDKGRGGG